MSEQRQRALLWILGVAIAITTALVARFMKPDASERRQPAETSSQTPNQ